MRVAVEKLKERINYDPATGSLTWRYCESATKSWNSTFAGKEAFTAKTAAGYRVSDIEGVKVYAHRAIWAMTYGEWPSECIDHINGDRLDNRLANLREASRARNNQNTRARKGSVSPYKGVSRQGNGWRARICIGGVQTFVGQFATEEEAARAYDEAAIRVFGAFAWLNFGRVAA